LRLVTVSVTGYPHVMRVREDVTQDRWTAVDHEWTLRLCRPGALIVADNIVRKGEVIEPASEDPSVRGVRRFMDRLAATTQATATVIQTVGARGYDGFAIIPVGGRQSREPHV
jgi:hypothetical protein